MFFKKKKDSFQRAKKALINNKGSYVHTVGWMKSLERGHPCTRKGEPLPWMNYPVVSFLQERLKEDFILFEYGSGYSTLFYSKYVKKVVSVEHNLHWYENLTEMVSENVQLYHIKKDVDGAYARTIKRSEDLYDVVIIDGRDRVNCIKQSMDRLSHGGVLLLDDSERRKYRKGIQYLTDNGFLHLSFEGLKPIDSFMSRATLFYRRDNCFTI